MSSSAGLRFSANLSFLFQEVPFLERFEMARRAGFRGVEFMWPQGEDLQAVRNAAEQAGVRVALFNFDAGDMAVPSEPGKSLRYLVMEYVQGVDLERARSGVAHLDAVERPAIHAGGVVQHGK